MRRWLPQIDQFDLEDQVGIGRDPGAAAGLAVGQLGRNDQDALAADPLAVDALVPALDDAAATDAKREGLARPLAAGRMPKSGAPGNGTPGRLTPAAQPERRQPPASGTIERAGSAAGT